MRKVLLTFFLAIAILTCCNSQENLDELREHSDSVCTEPDHKHFSGTTLGYITPWNINGLDLTLKYSAKFDIVSPCWFEIKPEELKGKFNAKVSTK
jgi:hypothetical protein